MQLDLSQYNSLFKTLQDQFNRADNPLDRYAAVVAIRQECNNLDKAMQVHEDVYRDAVSRVICEKSRR